MLANWQYDSEFVEKYYLGKVSTGSSATLLNDSLLAHFRNIFKRQKEKQTSLVMKWPAKCEK